MTPVRGGYAVDVPTINVSERARARKCDGLVDVQGIRRHASPSLHESREARHADDQLSGTATELLRAIPRNAHPDSERRRQPEMRRLLYVRDDLPGGMHLHRSRQNIRIRRLKNSPADSTST